MIQFRFSAILFGAALLAGAVPVSAQQDQAAVEARLRESLRNTMLQLRTAETEKAQAQAELQALKAETDKKIKDLTAAFEELGTRARDDQAAAAKQADELRGAVTTRDHQLGELAATLRKWQAEHARITAVARKKESERAGFQARALEAERLVAARERQNLELFQLANEILDRYRNFGLGRALAAREPFTGISRARLESLVEEYRGRIQDQLAKTGEAPAPQAPAAAPVP
jgi:hypothetical protein